MDSVSTFSVINLFLLCIVGFVLWTNIKGAKQEIMREVGRELADMRHQLRTASKGVSRLEDHVVDNREKILKLEVNLASVQDELEFLGGRINELQSQLGGKTDGEAPAAEEEEALTEVVPKDERKHFT